MSSSTFSPFSLAFSTPKKQHYHTYITSSSTSTNVHLQQEQGIKTPKQTHLIANTSTSSTKESKNNLLGRREVISTAIGVSVVGSNTNIFVQPQAALAGAEGVCEFTVSPSGLAFCDKLVGIGPQASAGQLIKAHYVGKLENGKVFDSSYGRGKPLTFRIGVGEVIKGWDQGILGTDGIPPMLAGGKRTLKIPPELGYGMRGAGCRGGTCIIPPDSVLFFDVEFIGKA